MSADRDIPKWEEQCLFCGKPATKLCDFPEGYPNWVGHPPKGTEVYDTDGKEISWDILNRCSRQICDDCATEFNGMDFCPYCLDRMQEVFNNRKIVKVLKRRRWRR